MCSLLRGVMLGEGECNEWGGGIERGGVGLRWVECCSSHCINNRPGHCVRSQHAAMRSNPQEIFWSGGIVIIVVVLAILSGLWECCLMSLQHC